MRLQVVAVLFLALMIIIQLNIFATRTPSLWWRFTDKTAPRPSIYLMIPVAAVLLVSTFIAVYWPEAVQPDGGRGVLIGAGVHLREIAPPHPGSAQTTFATP